MSRAPLFAVLALFAAPRAFAQDDDEPIPYSDEEESSPAPAASPDLREESEAEARGEVHLFRLDDPNLGVGGSLLAGALLLDSSAGRGVDAKFAWGLRFTWEFGRLIPADPFHEALFTDVSWTYGALHQGTRRIFDDSHFHYFTVAPAWELHLGSGTDYGVYGQLGAGMAYQYSGVHADGAETTIAGIKPLFQYGVGFRARPTLSRAPNLRLSLRLELTRFRRGYLDDTLVAASAGANF